MLWVKAFHLISIVAWFAGLFYLPRLYVYHCQCQDSVSHDRFVIMEYRLYKYIMRPAATLTLIFGLWLITFNHAYYLSSGWMHAKIGLLVLLYGFHKYLDILRQQLANNNNQHGERFYRIINEVPTLLLISIVILAVVRPF